MLDERKSGFSSIAAAVMGVVVGMGVAIAGVLALRDKGEREKVKGVLVDIKDQAIDYVKETQQQVQNKMSKAEEKVKKAVNLAKNA